MKSEIQEPDEYFLIGQDDERVTIYLRYPLFKALEEFAKRESQTEQVGLLVGREAPREGGGTFLLVEDAIEAPLGDEATGRFEEGLWRRARRIASARHPNRAVVGWFHTHLDNELEVSDEERSVHKRFFPEEGHLLYVISAKGQDRNFFYRVEGELVPARGFRIYGKVPTTGGEEPVPAGARAGINAVEASPEQQARHVERNMEKVLRHLQHPPIATKDIVIVALLVLNALLIWFRPNPPVTVDTSALERGQSQLSAEISSVRDRIQKLEKNLAEVKLLDEQLRLAAGLEDIGDVTTDLELPEDASTPAVEESPTSSELKGGSGAIRLYEVVAGDTLGVLVTRFYPDAPEGTTRAFAEFNRLKAPDYAIFPGDRLKVPPLEALRNS